MSENKIKRSTKDDSIYAQKFWKLYDILVKKAHETYDKIDEDAVYEIDLECIFRQFMTDEFAIPEEKTEKPAKSKKSPER